MPAPRHSTVAKPNYSWITGVDSSIVHVAELGCGAFGEVHKVLNTLITFRHQTDTFYQLKDLKTGKVSVLKGIKTDHRRFLPGKHSALSEPSPATTLRTKQAQFLLSALLDSADMW